MGEVNRTRNAGGSDAVRAIAERVGQAYGRERRQGGTKEGAAQLTGEGQMGLEWWFGSHLLKALISVVNSALCEWLSLDVPAEIYKYMHGK